MAPRDRLTGAWRPVLILLLAALWPWAAFAQGAGQGAEQSAVSLDSLGRSLYVPGEVLLLLQPGMSLQSLGAPARALVQASTAQAMGGGTGDGPEAAPDRVLRLRLAGGASGPTGSVRQGDTSGEALSVPEAVAALRADPAVRAADPNYYNYRFYTPGDPQYGEQWALDNTNQTLGGTAISYFNPPGSADHDIDAPEVYDLGYDGTGIVIAIIDDGAVYTHTDLAANMADTSGYTPNSANHGYDYGGGATPDDPMPALLPPPCAGTWEEVSHGTHVSGIAAAVQGNGLGGQGVAFGAKLVAVKVFPDVCDGASDASIIAAINYVAANGVAAHGANGVRVANMSLGRGGSESTVMTIALQTAIAAGVLFVVAAGNEESNNDFSPRWPANNANIPGTAAGVISVAATHQADGLASFSNIGPTTVTLAAPGVNIYSTIRDNFSSDNWDYWAGTSMASPVVAGVAALVLDADPTLTPAQVKQRLIESGDDLPGGGCSVQSSRRVNAYNAVNSITSPPPCAALTVLSSSGSSACLVTWLGEGTLSREALDPLRDLRELLWQQGPWGRAVVRGYYRGSAIIIAWARGVGARSAAAAAGGAVTTAI